MFKRIVSRIMAVLICMSLSGCGDSQPQVQTEITEQTTVTTPTDLTEEEMEIWESMPEIVTMRVYNDFRREISEILYITKYGETKCFISENFYDYQINMEQIYNEIINTDVKYKGEIDIHKLIEFYALFLTIDKDTKLMPTSLLVADTVEPITYSYEVCCLYGYNEVLTISEGFTRDHSVLNSSYGKQLVKQYLELDKFEYITGI